MGCGQNSKQVTSCSPFTATCVGMMFDARPGVVQSNFEPTFDNSKRLGTAFYQMHNGNYFAIDRSSAGDLKRTTARSAARYKQWSDNKWPSPASGWDDSAMSIVWHNLGYQIDPRDMRRGDLVGVDWFPSHGGHAVFVWDVHLDASGAVDCFTFLSSNGTSAHGGAGISVYCGNWTKTFTLSDGKYACKASPVFADHDAADDDVYTKHGAWHVLPNKAKSEIDLKTFRVQPTIIVDSSSPTTMGAEYVGSLRVVRFWGVAPPSAPHGTLLGAKAGQAHDLTRWQPPEPHCMGSSAPPGRIEKLQPAQVPKSHPDPIKATPPKPAPPQKKEQVVAHQHFVEDALAELYEHKWIEVHAGEPTSVGDPKTKAAVEDFQRKFKVPPVDGIAGPKTRLGLERALADLRAGKPNLSKPPPPPKIDRFYWLTNRVAPGGTSGLTIEIPNKDGWKSFEITLTDQHNKSSKVPIPISTFYGRGSSAVAIPAEFGVGSVLSARLRGNANGTLVDKTTMVPLYVGGVAAPAQDEWPWDEAKWNPYMRGVIAELRATPKGPGAFTLREVTQYGVKESLKPGDVPIMGKVGKNVVALPLASVDKLGLYLADIEGTLRWQGRILNIVQSGNVYDKPVTRVINGQTVTKMKPTLDKFDPTKSIWVDVTEHHPWGSGARMPLIPFRVLAHNARTEPALCGRIVYVQQLDGIVLPTGEKHNGMCVVGDQGGMAPPGKQFDFFVGREDHHIQLTSLGASQGGSVCNVEVLGPSAAYSKKQG